MAPHLIVSDAKSKATRIITGHEVRQLAGGGFVALPQLPAAAMREAQ